MKLETLQKLGGVSIILGSALLAAYSICFSTLLPIGVVRSDPAMAVNNPNWVWIALVAFIGVIFMLFGFMAVYSRIHESAGALGLIGFIFVETAYLFQACKVTWEMCVYPVICSSPAFAPMLKDFILQSSHNVEVFKMWAMATIFLGIILFCLAIFRSKRFPKAAGALVFAGAMIYGFGPMLTVGVAISGIVIFSAGCFMLGLKLMKPQQPA